MTTQRNIDKYIIGKIRKNYYTKGVDMQNLIGSLHDHYLE